MSFTFTIMCNIQMFIEENPHLKLSDGDKQTKWMFQQFNTSINSSNVIQTYFT